MKEIYGLLGTAFMMGGFAPYLYALWHKTAKPHAFSWLLWGLMNGIVAVVQFVEHAGPGAWTAGIAALFNLGIGIYAIKHGERNITKSDWSIFIGVLAAIPLWALTKDPLLSVILVSILDTLAFVPTLRKAWHRPHEEVAMTFGMGVIGFGLSIVAMQSHSFAAVLYPAKCIVTSGLCVLILLYRRSALTSCTISS